MILIINALVLFHRWLVCTRESLLHVEPVLIGDLGLSFL